MKKRQELTGEKAKQNYNPTAAYRRAMELEGDKKKSYGRYGGSYGRYGSGPNVSGAWAANLDLEGGGDADGSGGANAAVVPVHVPRGSSGDVDGDDGGVRTRTGASWKKSQDGSYGVQAHR